MKKVLATALVALMVASTVFAGLTGSANVDFGFNFDTKDYGFDNGKAIEVKYNLVTDGAEKVGEGSVYGGIKGSLVIDLDKDGTIKAPVLKVSDAYVKGEKFEVSILGNAGGNDFAKSALDKDGNDPASYKLPYATVAGVNGKVFDYGFGFGLEGNAEKGTFTTAASFATPEYTLAEGLKLKAGVHGAFDVKTAVENAGGASLALSYANDTLSASVASDMGLVLTKNGDKLDPKFDADVAANFKFAPVTVDVYYATKAAKIENLLSAQVVTDLASFDVPVTITLAGKDLVNKQDLSAAVGVKLADLKLNATVNAGYVVDAKTWSTGLDADYTLDNVAKFEAGFGLKGAKEVTEATVYAKATNDTLINNAALSLGYASGNLIKADDKGNQYGSVVASCTIKF